jgi:hypothetical protein
MFEVSQKSKSGKIEFKIMLREKLQMEKLSLMTD